MSGGRVYTGGYSIDLNTMGLSEKMKILGNHIVEP